MTDEPDIDNEIERAILRDASDAAGRVMERREIQPLNKDKESSLQSGSKGPNWIDLMPAIPGTTINPAANAKDEEIAAMEASGIRRPGYDTATETIIGEVTPPSIPGGITDEAGINSNIMPTNAASSKNSGVNAAKNSTPK